ncbi:undecaprenyl-diphosphate phosphatase [Asticcacaulis sp. EMRT-3]|uniref:undecaprenyl-diphosphate phosphatase n=1 Tax=Asticcacaulis sp. EMRT-3 TaxID=3040349 RepID=UPI0024AF43D7|nr:undecaprenyl-diphosphate phosphatase [Asticcacaulis sp. EMRT-3]MDI7775590.1 undecaprenyl-diphosphate phosphatase [Asticcacaulis sp. EMRT-3]
MHNLIAALLGLIEGLTEFIPVSSTAHLLIAAKLLHFESAADAFEVLIQLGAILAVVVFYFAKLWNAVVTLPSSADSRRFALSVLIAFAPAVVLGVGLHSVIKAMFERIDIICYALIIGGILLWAVDRFAPRPVHDDATKLDLKTSIAIGFFQCLAMIPGMSRSGSTLIGALLFKVEKRAAAEFSFFLAIPTMLGAFAFDFFKSYKLMSADDYGVIAIGFVVAFISALFVIKPLLAFVSKRGYGVFAIWRIIVGGGGLLLLHFTHLLG